MLQKRPTEETFDRKTSKREKYLTHMYWQTIEKHPEKSAHVERDLCFVERDLYRWRETYL